jgi:hypothetical protein
MSLVFALSLLQKLMSRICYLVANIGVSRKEDKHQEKVKGLINVL